MLIDVICLACSKPARPHRSPPRENMRNFAIRRGKTPLFQGFRSAAFSP